MVAEAEHGERDAAARVTGAEQALLDAESDQQLAKDEAEQAQAALAEAREREARAWAVRAAVSAARMRLRGSAGGAT